MATAIAQSLSKRAGPLIYNRQTTQHEHEQVALTEFFTTILLYHPPLDVIDETYALKKHLLDEAIDAGHYNNKPESANHIDSFVTYYEIEMSQFNPSETSGYKTFNEFFTRHVRSERRPVASPGDDTVITSPADCRLMLFDNIDQAKTLLIKGKSLICRPCSAMTLNSSHGIRTANA